MAHYAKVESGVVTQVIVADSKEWCETNLGGTWVQTSYNTAGIGYSWDGTGFAAPQPYPSWNKNSTTYLWEAPTPMPTDDKRYTWDEATTSWVEVEAL